MNQPGVWMWFVAAYYNINHVLPLIGQHLAKKIHMTWLLEFFFRKWEIWDMVFRGIVCLSDGLGRCIIAHWQRANHLENGLGHVTTPRAGHVTHCVTSKYHWSGDKLWITEPARGTILWFLAVYYNSSHVLPLIGQHLAKKIHITWLLEVFFPKMRNLGHGV